MEHYDCWASRPSRKRKLQEANEGMLSFPMDELNQDLLERVLSRLPTSTFFRMSSVCKRWKFVADSQSFKLACSEIPSRDPWFFMVDPHLNQPTIFDSAERSWKKLDHPPLFQQNPDSDSMPVAASGGLVCFRSESGSFTICNPVTGSCRKLPPAYPALENASLQAIAMNTHVTNKNSYKLVLVSGELPNLSYKVFNSSSDCWEDELSLKRKGDDAPEVDSADDNAVYFLSKAGNVVATDMLRSPSKQFSSVITLKDGQETVYFLSASGTILACNLTCKSYTEYPRCL